MVNEIPALHNPEISAVGLPKGNIRRKILATAAAAAGKNPQNALQHFSIDDLSHRNLSCFCVLLEKQAKPFRYVGQ
jgi:hypothetical protein